MSDEGQTWRLEILTDPERTREYNEAMEKLVAIIVSQAAVPVPLLGGGPPPAIFQPISRMARYKPHIFRK